MWLPEEIHAVWYPSVDPAAGIVEKGGCDAGHR